MPLTVFIERIENLPEQVVVLTQRQIAQIVHEQLVDQRFEHQVQSDERFRPVVSNEQFLNDFTQRLPHRVRLPESFAVGSEARIDVLKLPDAVSDSLNATHFVGRLKGCRDNDAPAGSHLSDVGCDHLKAVARVSQRSNHARENVQPCRAKVGIVSSKFDLFQDPVDEDLLISLNPVYFV